MFPAIAEITVSGICDPPGESAQTNARPSGPVRARGGKPPLSMEQSGEVMAERLPQRRGSDNSPRGVGPQEVLVQGGVRPERSARITTRAPEGRPRRDRYGWIRLTQA